MATSSIEPYAFQQAALAALIEKRSALLDAPLGAGKTVVGALWLRDVAKFWRSTPQLVIAPRRVLDEVWRPMLTAVCDGATVVDVTSASGFRAWTDWDIGLMSNRVLRKGLHTRQRAPLAGRVDAAAVLIDEATTVLTGTNAAALRKWLKLEDPRHRLAMSATPMARGLTHAWALYALVSRGNAGGSAPMPLGYKSNTAYLDGTHDDVSPRHLNFPIYRPKPGAAKRIAKSAAVHTVLMRPDFKEVQSTTRDERIVMSSEASAAYATMKKAIVDDAGVPMAGGRKVLALRQRIQKAKHAMLAPLFAELREPLLVWVEFRADRAQVHEAATKKGLSAMDVGATGAIDLWNRRALDVLVANPAEAAHGLNLQKGGRAMLWFTLPWSLELYDQAIGRLKRHGQKATVYIERWVVANTVEDRVAQALTERRNVVREWRAYFKEAA